MLGLLAPKRGRGIHPSFVFLFCIASPLPPRRVDLPCAMHGLWNLPCSESLPNVLTAMAHRLPWPSQANSNHHCQQRLFFLPKRSHTQILDKALDC